MLWYVIAVFIAILHLLCRYSLIDNMVVFRMLENIVQYIPVFVMYCIYGVPGSSLLIGSMTVICFKVYFTISTQWNLLVPLTAHCDNL